jgi:hypothetical protein
MVKKLIGGHAEPMFVYYVPGKKLRVVRDVNSMEEAERADVLINLWEEMYKGDRIEIKRWVTYECRSSLCNTIVELVDKAWRQGATWREVKQMLESLQL